MMKVAGVRDTKCCCGKRPFYSQAAALFALGTAVRAGQTTARRRECRAYECDATPGVWHLTSTTDAQHARRQRLWALCALTQWAAPVDYTMRIRPGARLSNPNVVRVIWR